MIKNISKEQYTKVWKVCNGSPLESWQWGEFKSHNWKIERYGFYIEGSISGCVTLFIKKFPFSFLTNLLGYNSFAYIPRGFPVNDSKNINSFLKELDDFIKMKKFAFVVLDPGLNLLDKRWNGNFKNALKLNGWNENGTTIQPNQTNIISLSESEGEIFSNMKPKWKRNINKAKRHGVKVNELKDDNAISRFYEIISDVSKNTDFKIHSKEYFSDMWENLKVDNLVRIFIAEADNKLLASYLILTSKNSACEIYGGANKAGRDLEAGYLLKWEIMKQMKKEGKLYYDQWGVAPKDDLKHPLSGITYFKEGFGGEFVQFLPQYAKVKSKFLFGLFKLKF